MLEREVYTFEAQRGGKPDQLELAIAYLAGAELLDLNHDARFDLRVSGSYNHALDRPIVRIWGEVSASLLGRSLEERLADIVASHYNKVHRTDFSPGDIEMDIKLDPQSEELALNGYNGDTGETIAVAVANTPHSTPWERELALGLRNVFDDIYQSGGCVPDWLASASGIEYLGGLEPDGKVSVRALFGKEDPGGIIKPADLDYVLSITMALQHDRMVNPEGFAINGAKLIHSYLSVLGSKYGIDFGNPEVKVKPFVVGGWKADSGLRDAKPHIEWFGSRGVSEDGGAGENSNKPSLSKTVLAFALAKHIVQRGLAGQARVTLWYDIMEDNTNVHVSTQGTGTVPQEKIVQFASGFDLRNELLANRFALKSPDTYRRIAAAGDAFHTIDVPWQRPDVLLYRS